MEKVGRLLGGQEAAAFDGQASLYKPGNGGLGEEHQGVA